MKQTRSIYMFLLTVLLVPFIAYQAYSWYEDKYLSLPVLNDPKSMALLTDLGKYRLINQDSLPAVTNHKIVVADFFFTHCPSVCPKMTRNLIEINNIFLGDPDVELFSVSVDPVHDNPSALRRYIKRFKIDTRKWQFVTGPKKDIYMLARNAFSVVATDGDGGPSDFIHSDKLVLLDAKRNIRGYYAGTDKNDINRLEADIKKLKHED